MRTTHITEEGIRGLTIMKTPYLATPICALVPNSSFHSVDSLENHKIKKNIQTQKPKPRIHFTHLSSLITGPQN